MVIVINFRYVIAAVLFFFPFLSMIPIEIRLFTVIYGAWFYVDHKASFIGSRAPLK